MNNDLTLTGGENPLLAGRYQVVRQLGTGGMGSVWLAEDRQLDNKLFAVKMLPSVLVSNKRAYRQLKDEAIVAMKLVHPNIVQIRAFEENNGNPFLVMDYIEGQTLDDYLAEKGKLTEDETVRLLKPIASALDYAHGEGVVHRDVKPANVMIRKDGHPYILDFGIAREIQETMTRVTGKLSSGTLLYMSPEQLRGQPPKAAQDVYSFAVMAYECLKGGPPFSRGQVEYQILNEQPEPLPSGLRLAASIMRGLSKKPEARQDSCVKVLIGGLQTRQMPSTRTRVVVPTRTAVPIAERTIVSKKRNVLGIVLPLICLIVSLIVVGGVMWHRESQRHENALKLALRLQQEDNERRAQEEAVRKKGEADRIAMQKQEEARRQEDENRLAADRNARKAALAISIEAREQFDKVEKMSDADGFKYRKETLVDIFKRAETFNDEKVKRWADAVDLYKEFVAKSKSLVALDEQRQRAVSKKAEARSSSKAAEQIGAKRYARDSWNSAVKTWQSAADQFSRSEFEDAATTFGKAMAEFNGCFEEAKNNKQIEDRNAELRRQEEEREADRKRKFEQYAAVQVGSLVQISTDDRATGRLGVVIDNKNGVIQTRRNIGGGMSAVSEYPYDKITNLIVQDDVDKDTIMRKTLVGKWTGTTVYSNGNAPNNREYIYEFYEDGTTKQVVIIHGNFQSPPYTSMGEWHVSGDGTVLTVNFTSGMAVSGHGGPSTCGTSAGNRTIYRIEQIGEDEIVFKYDVDSLKYYDGIGKSNLYNERFWYDSAGVLHFEADGKARWAKAKPFHLSETETPRIMKRIK